MEQGIKFFRNSRFCAAG